MNVIKGQTQQRPAQGSNRKPAQPPQPTEPPAFGNGSLDTPTSRKGFMAKDPITIASRKEEAHWSSFRNAVSSVQKSLLQSSNEIRAKPPHMQQSETPRFDFIGLDEIDAGGFSHLTSNILSPLNEDGIASQTAASRAVSEALSTAEQQLAKMKQQLALTEAERDELEFELIQTKSGVGD